MEVRAGGPLEQAYHWERSAPDKSYLVQPVGGGVVESYTWKQTLDQARRMAAHLLTLGFPPGSHIALISKNCAHFIIADLAIWIAGHVSVPLYPTVSVTTVRQILTHSEARLLFVGKLDEWHTQVSGVPEGLPCIKLPLAPAAATGGDWNTLIAAQQPVAGHPVRGADELATIIYTSGSTGEPKGAMITFGAIAGACRSLLSTIDITPDERSLSHLPLAHVAERFTVECGSLFGGGQIFFAESLDTFLDDLRRARPTVFLTVPRLWQKFQLGVFSKVPQAKLDRLLSIPIVSCFIRRKILRGLGLEHVRLAATGAAPIPPELLTWYRRLGLPLLEGYAMTENFACSHGTRPGRVRPGYVGEPYPGVECRISDEGEVQVKSPGLMRGYYKAPELTAESFTADGFLRTGDRGEIDAQGLLRITGRVKELFKTSKGKYVAPAPIENKLANFPGIEAVCVGGLGYPQPHGLVMLDLETRRRVSGAARGEFQAALAAHLTKLNQELEAHEALAFVAVVKDEWQVANGFLTPTLKIRRAVIEKTYAAALDGWYATKQPVLWQERPVTGDTSCDSDEVAAPTGRRA